MGALILLILACWWPSPAPAPSQPLDVEVSLGDTADTRMAPAAGHPRPEAVDPETAPEARPGEPEAREADPGLGGVP